MLTLLLYANIMVKDFDYKALRAKVRALPFKKDLLASDF